MELNAIQSPYCGESIRSINFLIRGVSAISFPTQSNQNAPVIPEDFIAIRFQKSDISKYTNVRLTIDPA